MSILLESLVKRYDGHPVVQDVTLEIADGEFFVLLGPSGSGKSTILRMIAGLAPIDEGRVVLHGRDVTAEPPQRRGIGLVFQHYALFRSMSVARNIEFSLSVRKVPAGERRRRRDELLELVGLSGLGHRYPHQLSGGQKQRVALARALAHRPAVLLLDEPFGSLDAPTRADLRRAVRGVQRELGITTIFVTHDQEEAFELADRIGLMHLGRILEVAPPADLYLRPRTEFAATFLGTANLMVGVSAADGVRLGPVRFPASAEREAGAAGRVQVLFRPEDVAIGASESAIECPALGRGVVEEQSFAGSFERVRLRVPILAGVRPIAPTAPFGGDSFVVEALRTQDQTRRFPLAVGERAWVGVRRIHALAHPGLSLLLATDGTPEAGAALALGAEIARRAHARVTLVAHGEPEERLRQVLQAARDSVGIGLASLEARTAAGEIADAVAREVAGPPHDLVVHALPARGAVGLAERLLEAGEHNLLLVPGPGPVPSRVLVCVAVGEPGKEDVQFAARLVRHLGARATILSVLREGRTDVEVAQAERFLAAGARSMALLGVPAGTAVRMGSLREVVEDELRAGGHDLLVLGAPLPARPGEVSLDGPVGEILAARPSCPVLIVRSHQA